MKRLELVVGHTRHDDRVDELGMIRSEPVHERCDTRAHLVPRRRGNEPAGFNRHASGPCHIATSDDDLTLAQPPGLLLQWCSAHKAPLEVLNEGQGERTSFIHPVEAEPSHTGVVEDLSHLNGRRHIVVRLEYLVERSVRPLER